MSIPPGDPTPNVSSSFEQLAKNAKFLNQASDRLNGAIDELNEALKSLNLGISSWVPFIEEGEDPFLETYFLGYGKIYGKWGIGIKHVSEDRREPETQTDETEWQFSEAPRDLRIKAIPNLGKLIDQLNVDAEQVSVSLQVKAIDAHTLATVIKGIAKDSAAKPSKGGK